MRACCLPLVGGRRARPRGASWRCAAPPAAAVPGPDLAGGQVEGEPRSGVAAGGGARARPRPREAEAPRRAARPREGRRLDAVGRFRHGGPFSSVLLVRGPVAISAWRAWWPGGRRGGLAWLPGGQIGVAGCLPLWLLPFLVLLCSGSAWRGRRRRPRRRPRSRPGPGQPSSPETALVVVSERIAGGGCGSGGPRRGLPRRRRRGGQRRRCRGGEMGRGRGKGLRVDFNKDRGLFAKYLVFA